MPDIHDDCIIANPGYTLESEWPHRAVPTAALLSGALLSACGGGGGSAPDTPAPPPPPPALPTALEASRFLAQASMGATREHIAKVQRLGYAGWLDEQFALPAPACAGTG